MPLYQTIHTLQAATIGIWRIEESVDDLKRGLPPNLWQQNLYRSITSIRRQKEWLATRALVRQLIPNEESGEIVYNSFGKPILHQNTRQLSISHSHHFAAVIVHSHKALGIDIEPIHPRILRLQHKFLSEKEATQIPQNDLFMLTLYWSAKETLYKLYSKKELRFKENLLIHRHYKIEDSTIAAEGYLEASICKDDFQWNVKVYYQQIEDNILTYTFENV
ncbi:MAG: 4'-phosphopantetheinyl transferase superfamily protein [Chitinophagales bacterium]